MESAWLVMGRGRYTGVEISLIRVVSKSNNPTLLCFWTFYKVVVVSKQKEIIHQSDDKITKAQKMLGPTHTCARRSIEPSDIDLPLLA